jgi:preprotein translocase subunit SecA
VSLEDELMRRFGGERIKTVMNWAGMGEDTPIENRLITKSIGSAQVKVEGYHFDMRKHLLEFDDVLNKQREVIYGDRVQIVAGENLKERILLMMRQEFQDMMRQFLASRHADDWDVPGFLHELGQVCPLPADLNSEDKVYQWSQNAIWEKLSDHAEAAYADREAAIGPDQMRILERLLLLRSIDTHWVNHLTAMENLRTGIGLHAYGQRDPLVMYRTEGHKMFQDLLGRMQEEVVRTLFHVTVTQQPANGGRRPSPAAKAKASPMQAVLAKGREAAAIGAAKVGRNTPCTCGSGKKYKRCHGANV